MKNVTINELMEQELLNIDKELTRINNLIEFYKSELTKEDKDILSRLFGSMEKYNKSCEAVKKDLLQEKEILLKRKKIILNYKA